MHKTAREKRSEFNSGARMYRKKSAQLLFFFGKMFLKRFLDLVSDTSDDAK